MIGAPTPLSACNPAGTVVRRGAARAGTRHGKRQRASPARRHGPARRPPEGPARSPLSDNGRSVMRASAELNRAASAGMNQHTAGPRCGSARLGSGTHPNARLLATVQMVTALYGAVTVLDAPDAAGARRSGGTAQTRSRADPERRSAGCRRGGCGRRTDGTRRHDRPGRRSGGRSTRRLDRRGQPGCRSQAGHQTCAQRQRNGPVRGN